VKHSVALSLSAIVVLAAGLAGCTVQAYSPPPQPVYVAPAPQPVYVTPAPVYVAPPVVVVEGAVVDGVVIVAPPVIDDWVFINGGWYYYHPSFHRWVFTHHPNYWEPPHTAHVERLHSWSERPRHSDEYYEHRADAPDNHGAPEQRRDNGPAPRGDARDHAVVQPPAPQHVTPQPRISAPAQDRTQQSPRASVSRDARVSDQRAPQGEPEPAMSGPAPARHEDATPAATTTTRTTARTVAPTREARPEARPAPQPAVVEPAAATDDSARSTTARRAVTPTRDTRPVAQPVEAVTPAPKDNGNHGSRAATAAPADVRTATPTRTATTARDAKPQPRTAAKKPAVVTKPAPADNTEAAQAQPAPSQPSTSRASQARGSQGATVEPPQADEPH
jgi:hypothetical protein